MAQDIYEAIANQGQRNGSLYVYAGSPVVKGNMGSGFNEKYPNPLILITLPTVTGLTSASGLGQLFNAISGMYDTRLDDVTYYV